MTVDLSISESSLIVILVLVANAAASAYFVVISILREARLRVLGDALLTLGLVALASHEVLHVLGQGGSIASELSGMVAAIMLPAGALLALARPSSERSTGG